MAIRLNKSYIHSNKDMSILDPTYIDYGNTEVFKGNTKNLYDLEEEETEK